MYRKNYAPQKINGKMSVWLQGRGWQSAKQGKDIEAGDVLMYNYGYTAVVTEIKKETPKTRLIVVREDHDGKLYDQRIKKETWWAVT